MKVKALPPIPLTDFGSVLGYFEEFFGGALTKSEKEKLFGVYLKAREFLKLGETDEAEFVLWNSLGVEVEYADIVINEKTFKEVITRGG